jgi:hypothetical protein
MAVFTSLDFSFILDRQFASNSCNPQCNKHFLFCEISGSHGGQCQYDSLVGYCAVYFHISLPTFQRCLLPPSLRHDGGSKRL